MPVRNDYNHAYHLFDRIPPHLPLMPLSVARHPVTWGPGDIFKQERSRFCSFEFVIDGNAYFIQNDNEYVVNPGELFIIHRGRKYLFKAGPAGFLKKRWAMIDGPALDSILMTTGLYEADRIKPAHPRRIERCLTSMSMLCKKSMYGNGWQLSQLAYAMIVELGQDIKPVFPRSVTAVLDFIQKNMGNDLHNADIAAHAGMSVAHIKRLFLRYLHMSPLHYHLQKRIDRARFLLQTTDKPVKEISNILGFTDQLHFSRVFKRIAGVAPALFRDRIQEHPPASGPR
jgi:AraC-like DNA-binding protein